MNTPEHLYSLLPSLHQARDLEQGQPLRALLWVLEQELRRVESDISGLYDNLFIETCAPWVMPYIGDLIGEKLSDSGLSQAVSSRARVGRAVHHRRRKGLPATLEQVIFETTGWRAHVVELFQRLVLTPHIRVNSMRRPGMPDTRSSTTGAPFGSPFDPSGRLADVRAADQSRLTPERHGLALFLWRSQCYPVTSTARLLEEADNVGLYTFHPLGIDVPLWTVARSRLDEQSSLSMQHVAGRLSDTRLRRDLAQLSAGRPDAATLAMNCYGTDRDICIFTPGDGRADLSDTVLHAAAISVADLPSLPSDAAFGSARVLVDPRRGRLAVRQAWQVPPLVRFHLGMAGDIGGGPYPVPERPVPSGGFLARVSADACARGEDGAYPSLNHAVVAWYRWLSEWCAATEAEPPPAVIQIADTQPQTLPTALLHIRGQLRIEAERGRVVVLAGSYHLMGAGARATLVLRGLWLEHPLTLAGALRLELDHCTLAPEATVALSAPQSESWLEVALHRCVTGPVSLPAEGIALRISDSVVTGEQGAKGAALEGPATVLERVTVLGTTKVRRLEATGCLLMGTVTVERIREGAIRASYVDGLLADSERVGLPPLWECLPSPTSPSAPGFVSMRFGDPGFAALHPSTAATICSLGPDGTEPGVWSFLGTPHRLETLASVLDEHLPAGLRPIVMTVLDGQRRLPGERNDNVEAGDTRTRNIWDSNLRQESGMATFVVSPYSKAVKVGDVVCSVDSVSVYRAESPSVLSQAGIALGIALSGARPGQPVLVAVAGVVPPSVTGLEASDEATLVGITERDDQGCDGARAHRVTSWEPGAYLIGIASDSGALTLSPMSPLARGTESTVVSQRPTSLQLDSSELVIQTEGEQPFPDVTVLDQVGDVMTGESVEWSSGDSAVVSLSNAGVTPLKNGKAVLTAACGRASSTITVTVALPLVPGQVRIAQATLSWSTVQIVGLPEVTVLDQFGAVMTGQTVTWASSDAGVVSVSGALATPKKNGTATLSATCGAAEATLNATVQVSLVPSALTVGVASIVISSTGPNAFPAVTVLDPFGSVLAGQTVAWSSSDTAVLLAGPNGYTPAGNGTARLIATCGKATASVGVTVAVGLVATTLELGAFTSPITTATERALPTVVVRDPFGKAMTGQPVVWTSSDDKVLSVTSSTATPRKNGAAKLQAKCGTATANLDVTISVALVPTTLSLSMSKLNLTGGVAGALPTVAVFDPFGAELKDQTVAWTSSDASVVTVAATTATPLKDGNAILTAACRGASATLKVTVANSPVTVPALHFDGNTLLLLGNPTGVDWRGTYSIEFWFKLDAFLNGFWLAFKQSDRIEFTISSKGVVNAGLGGIGVTSAENAMTPGQWAHVALTVDRVAAAPQAALYLNGKRIASGTPGAQAGGVQPMFVGGPSTEFSNWGPRFQGDLADLRLWSRALSAGDVALLQSQRPSTSAPGLVGWWAGVEPDGTVVTDLSPIGNHAVMLRGALSRTTGPTLSGATSLAAPKLLTGTAAGAALRFDGQATSYLQVPNHAKVQLKGDLTVETWIRLHPSQGKTSYLYTKSASLEGALYFVYDATTPGWTLRYYGEGNTAAGPNSTYCLIELASETWYHLTFVRDSWRRELRYYINGCLVRIDVGCAATTTTTSTDPVIIGKSLPADLAEMRVWSVARDEETIRADLGRRVPQAAGLVARWAIDEGSGAPRNSTEAGSALDATVTGTVTWLKDGPALLPAVADRAVRPSVVFPLGRSGRNMTFMGTAYSAIDRQMTAEMWLKVEQPVTTTEMLMVLDAKLWRQWLKGTIAMNWSGASAKATVPTGWFHLAMVREMDADPTKLGTGFVYINGLLVEQTAAGSHDKQPQEWNFGRNFVGQVADLRLWSTLRTQAEIQTGMVSRVRGDEKGLVAAWPMDEGSGSIVLDRRGLSHGVLNGLSWDRLPASVGPQGPIRSFPVVKPTSASVSCWPVLAGGSSTLAFPIQGPMPATWTIETWLRSSVDAQSGPRIAMQGPSGLKAPIDMCLSGGKIYLASARKDGTTVVGADSGVALPLKTWTHVALVHDATQQKAFLLLDGVLKFTTPFANPLSDADTSDDYLRLSSFQGAVAEYRVWKVARDAAAIQATMRTRVTGTEPNLLHAWSLDDGPSPVPVLVDKVTGNAGLAQSVVWEYPSATVVKPF